MFRYQLAAVLILLLGLAASCGSRGDVAGLAGPATPQPQVLTELPEVSALRSASGVSNRLIEGSDYLMRSQGAEADPNNTTMTIDASAGSRQFALYGLQPAGALVSTVDVMLPAGQSATGAYWVGCADFSAGRWIWHGPYTGSSALPGLVSTNSMGYLFIAVLAPEGSSVVVDKLNLHLSGEGVHAVLTADPPEGDAPLGVGFNASDSQSFDGAITKYEWDFDEDGIYEVDGGSNPHEEQGYGSPGNFTVGLRVTDELGFSAEASVKVKVTLFGDIPPVAGFNVQPAYREVGQNCAFDASASSDPDGSIVLYLWDFDGDGDFETDSGDQPHANHIYSEPGKYEVGLRVVDDLGLQTDAIQQIEVHGWLNVKVDAAGDVGSDLSLADINGGPAIAYYDQANGNLKYAVAGSADGANAVDWTVLTVDPDINDSGQQPSLALINGYPAISHFDSTAGALRYSYCDSPLGANPSFWHTVLLDTSEWCGQSSSLDVVDGKPAISYYASNKGLAYCRAKNGTGEGGPSQWDFVTIPGSPGDGLYTSLEVINGHPAIAFMDKPFDDMDIAFCSDGQGINAGNWSSQLIDEDSETGKYPNVLSVGGLPAVAYYSSGEYKLQYVRSGSVAGGSWPTKLTLDGGMPGMPAGYSCSMALIGGKPAIAYFAGTGSGTLRYTWSTTQTGESLAFWQKEDVPTKGDVGGATALCQIDGRAALAYYDTDKKDLWYAIRY